MAESSQAAGYTIETSDVPQPLGWGFRAQTPKALSTEATCFSKVSFLSRASREPSDRNCCLTSEVWRLPGLAPGVKPEAKTIRSAREQVPSIRKHAKSGRDSAIEPCQANHSGGRQQEATRAQALLGPGDGRGHSPEGRKSFCIWVEASEAPAFRQPLGKGAGHGIAAMNASLPKPAHRRRNNTFSLDLCRPLSA
jgi:hypothetical protein